MPETLKGLWKQRLRWAQGGAEVFLVNLRRLFHWQHHRMWPLFLEYACSTLWAFAYAVTILPVSYTHQMCIRDRWNHWVKINGQVYALWYNGQFGEDNLYLLRPFSTASQTPAVTVRYRYTLNSIRSPEKDQPLTPSLSDGDKADLLRSLEVMQGNLLKDKPCLLYTSVFFAGILEPLGVSYLMLLAICIPVTLLAVMLTAIVCNFLGCELKDDPVYQERLAKGEVSLRGSQVFELKPRCV